MTRHLSIVEKTVGHADHAAYRESLRARQAAAKVAAANFWVFEHASDAHRYVEFVEGTDAAQVAHLANVEPGALWRAIEVT